VYTSAKEGYAKLDLKDNTDSMEPLFGTIVKHVPPPRAFASEGFQLLVANLDYSDYLGRIAFGKIYSGKITMGQLAVCIDGNGTNVALRIEQTNDPKSFAVSGRGEMQIAILVEQMRREGYEVLVSRPEVLWKKDAAGNLLEPIEKLFLEIPQEHMGPIMENLA